MENVVASNETVSTEHNVEELMKTYGTKSAVIRFLDGTGMKRGEIAKLMNIRYQHVRNVLTTELKKK